MAVGDVETHFADGAWRNRVDGEGTSALGFSTQQEAAESGRQQARETGGDHILLDEEGRVVTRTRYRHTGADTAADASGAADAS